MRHSFLRLQLALVLFPLVSVGFFAFLISISTAKHRRALIQQEIRLHNALEQDPVVNLMEQETTVRAKIATKPRIVLTVPPNKFAYVFYVSDEAYFCYVFVNVHRLVKNLEATEFADIVVLVMETLRIPQISHCKNFECFGKNFKIISVPRPPYLMFTGPEDQYYYRYCYVKFEAFRLYQYQRIILMDADGLVLRNLDHLFPLSLRGYDVAAVYAKYLKKKWLSSVLMVIKPNPELYEQITKFLNETKIKIIAKYANGNIYDMDILNYVLKSGILARILPQEYAQLDTEYAADGSSANVKLNKTFYVHFSFRKPHVFPESKYWKSDPDLAPSKMPRFLELFELYWSYANRTCSFLI